MTSYKLSALTNRELIELCDTLERLGFLLLKLKDMQIADDFELEALLGCACDELEDRILEDNEFIPERRDDD